MLIKSKAVGRKQEKTEHTVYKHCFLILIYIYKFEKVMKLSFLKSICLEMMMHKTLENYWSTFVWKI